MNKKHEEILIKVSCDIFEKLSFMFGEVIDLDEAESDSDLFIKADMSFKWEKDGTVEIIVPSELAESLAKNILGIDESDNLDQVSPHDALKELLNTICGRLLPAIFGDENIFDLYPPQTSEINYEEWESLLENKDYIVVEIEDNPVLIKALI